MCSSVVECPWVNFPVPQNILTQMKSEGKKNIRANGAMKRWIISEKIIMKWKRKVK